MVACFSCLYSSIDFRYLYTLGMADTHSPLSDYLVCKGDGYNVISTYKICGPVLIGLFL